jgi:hypothetical protein
MLNQSVSPVPPINFGPSPHPLRLALIRDLILVVKEG